MLRATPQLSAQPCSSSGLLFEHSRDSPGDTRLPDVVCTLDPYSRAVPTSATFELSRVTSRGPPSGPRAATMASQLCISEIQSGYPRYGERYDIGDNQYSSNNLSYCPINRFLELISNPSISRDSVVSFWLLFIPANRLHISLCIPGLLTTVGFSSQQTTPKPRRFASPVSSPMRFCHHAFWTGYHASRQ
jgi:hypothetical protein